jgi:hypothetical protein
MAYRNKTYVAFDASHDIRYYYLMKAWKQSDKTEFTFYDAHDLNSARDTSLTESIKQQLRIRMANCKMFVLLLGDHTKYHTRFVKWEVEHAIYLKLPIVVVNIDGESYINSAKMPTWLNDYPCIVCSFNARILQYSLENWDVWHKEYIKDPVKSKQHYTWKDSVYISLGLH